MCCQNKKQKHITVDQRNLCTFLINYTTNAYIIQEKNIVLAQNEFINKIELELKEELFYNQNIPSILNDFSERFIKILSADGLIIKSPNGLSKYGDTPSDKTFEAIVNEINSIAKDQFIYTTHSFSNDKINKTLNTKNCTGIARINFDKEAFYSIYLFRKEIIKEEIWAGIPEKIKNLSADKKNYTYSLEPRLMLGKNK
nr:hypothetical protein [uncultured Flavobacterium sp.]